MKNTDRRQENQPPWARMGDSRISGLQVCRLSRCFESGTGAGERKWGRREEGRRKEVIEK